MEMFGSPSELLNEAYRLLRERRPAEAVARLQRVLLSDPDNFEALHYMGIARGQQGLLEEAENYLRRALSIRPDHALARYHLGYVLHRKGAVEEARWNLEEALRLDPSLAGAKRLLAELAGPRAIENLANFWARAASAFADSTVSMLVFVPVLVVALLAAFGTGQVGEAPTPFEMPGPTAEFLPPLLMFHLQLSILLITFAVHAVPWAIWGRSPGMFAVGLHLVDREGRRPAPWRALVRWLVYQGYQAVVLPAPFLGLVGQIYANALSFVGLLLFFVNIALIAGTARRQAVHDLAAGTFVVGRSLPAWLSLIVICGLLLFWVAVTLIAAFVAVIPAIRP